LIQAIVDVMKPKAGSEPKGRLVICDPACGTGGFLLAAHEFIRRQKLDKAQLRYLNAEQLRGVELVDGVARLCAMNLLLHGIGGDDAYVPILVKDALGAKHGEHEMVLTNPPFGKKSSVTIINEAGDEEKQSLIINRDDFWATTSNKQLNFLQHVFNDSETTWPRCNRRP
jgi:type I restriction enzyme M protein